MELDFDSTEEVADYVTVPTGTYLCRVAEVRQGSTRSGDERWSLRLIVVEGEFAGRQAAWDNLVFSVRGRTRVRKVLAALGLPTRGRVQLLPPDLEGRQAFVEVRPVEYTSGTGEVIRRNEVPYDGYRPLERAAEQPGALDPQARPSRAPAERGSGQAEDDEEEDDRIPF